MSIQSSAVGGNAITTGTPSGSSLQLSQQQKWNLF